MPVECRPFMQPIMPRYTALENHEGDPNKIPMVGVL